MRSHCGQPLQSNAKAGKKGSIPAVGGPNVTLGGSPEQSNSNEASSRVHIAQADPASEVSGVWKLAA